MVVRAITLVLVVVLAGVSGGLEKSMAAPAAGTPAYGGGVTMVWDTVWDYPDPQTSTMLSQGYINRLLSDTLTTLDAEGRVRPLLAERWRESADKLTYVLWLRPGVRFQDGAVFDANAVIFTYNRVAKHPIRRRPPDVIDAIQSMRAVAPNQIEFKIKSPDPRFLEKLSDPTLVMLSPKAASWMGAQFVQRPVGTGPFKFVSWKSNAEMVLRRNDDYWQGKPYLENFRVREIPSREVQALELEAGNAQVSIFVEAAPAQRLKQLGFSIDISAGISHRSIAINNHRAPLDDIRIRRALNLATNRKEYIDVNYLGLANPLITGVGQESWGYDADVARAANVFDRTRAGALLDEAGWRLRPDGFRYHADGRRLTLPMLWPNSPRRSVTKGEIFQSQMKAVGVDTPLQLVDRAVWSRNWEREPAGDHFLTMDGRGTGSLHPAAHAELYHTRTFRNIHKHNIREIDEVIERGTRTFFDRDAKVVYRRFQQLVVEHAFMVPIYNPGYVMAWSKCLKGDWVRDSSGAFIQFHKAWVQPGCK
jgi:peptide/nickel transport system substrate-binding protein